MLNQDVCSASVAASLSLEVVHGLEEDVEAGEEAADLHREQRAAVARLAAEVVVDQPLQLLKSNFPPKVKTDLKFREAAAPPHPDVLRVVYVVLAVPVEVEAEDGRAPRVVGLHRDQGDQRGRLPRHLRRRKGSCQCLGSVLDLQGGPTRHRLSFVDY